MSDEECTTPGLSVVFQPMLRDGSGFNPDDDGRACWRIEHAESGRLMQIQFGRKRDAVRAANVLNGLVDWTLDADEIKAMKLGPKVQRIIAESMAW